MGSRVSPRGHTCGSGDPSRPRRCSPRFFPTVQSRCGDECSIPPCPTQANNHTPSSPGYQWGSGMGHSGPQNLAALPEFRFLLNSHLFIRRSFLRMLHHQIRGLSLERVLHWLYTPQKTPTQHQELHATPLSQRRIDHRIQRPFHPVMAHKKPYHHPPHYPYPSSASREFRLRLPSRQVVCCGCAAEGHCCDSY